MLKLLLSAAFITPCFFLPFAGSTQMSQVASASTTSFDDVYVEPALDRLKRCEAAELDVFFYEDFITSHSAEYIAQSVTLTDECGQARYNIVPIISAEAGEHTKRQAKELSSVLKAHGVTAKITRPIIQSEFDSLSANGRAAKVKVTFEKGNDA